MFNKFDELNNLASLSHINIVGVTVTWLHGEHKDHEVSLPGYLLFNQNRPTAKEKDELPST